MADNVYIEAELSSDLIFGCDTDDFEHHADDEGDARRWQQSVTTIIRRRSDGQLFGIEWQRGLTENQDHDLPEVSPEGTMKWRPMVAVEVKKTEFKFA